MKSVSKGSLPARILARAQALRRRTWGLVGAGLAAVVATVVLLTMWSSGPPDPRARQYEDFDACLLTGPKGIEPKSPGAPVWAGMQKASADTRVRVSYLQVMGPQTVDNTLPHLNSLLLRQCQVVLAVGSAQVGAVETQVKRYPKVRFVVVDGEAEAAANITMFRSGDGLSDMVAESIKDAFGNAK